MALVTFGGGVALINGRIGGTVFAHNRGGNYARNFVKPTNPATAFQVAIRGFVALLVDKWLNFATAQQRVSWETYAANVAMTNRVGDTIFLTGQQHYVRSGVPRLQAGFFELHDAPTIFNLGDFTAPTFTGQAGSPGSIITTFEPADDWANEDNAIMLIQTSREQNPSVNYFQSPFRFVDTIDGNSAGPPASPDTMATPFDFTAANRIFGRARVSRADGRLSAAVSSPGLIT